MLLGLSGFLVFLFSSVAMNNADLNVLPKSLLVMASLLLLVPKSLRASLRMSLRASLRASLCGVGGLVLLCASVARADNLDSDAEKYIGVASPDGALVFEVAKSSGPVFRVRYQGKPIISPSRLGLQFMNRLPFGRDFAEVSFTRSQINTEWEQPWGERRLVVDHHNSLEVVYASEKDEKNRYAVEVRVYNDGFGFRYKCLTTDDAPVAIIAEDTQFTIPDSDKARAWWIPSNLHNRYEYTYNIDTPLHDLNLAHTPVTIRHATGAYLSFHEAALVDYSGMSLHQRRPGILRTRLSPWSDGILVRTQAGFKTPWRTVQVSAEAHELMNSDLILNLNEPSKIADVSWIEPGRYIGIWWGMHIGKYTWGSGEKHGATTANTKAHLDFAAEHGFSGVLVEGWNIGWDGDWFNNGEVMDFVKPYPDFDFDAVAQYARDKGVRVVGHHETSGHITNYENQMAEAFALYKKHGVRVVKTGYVADAGEIERVDDQGILRNEWHDGQFMVDHFIRNVTEAAKNQISIVTHEPVKDTGLRRTYPNWVSREGARGQEYNAWGTPPNAPSHTAVLPFTRMLSGPMDFTAGIFDLMPHGKDNINRVETTLAKQLALYVVLYAPFQMAADLPENYLKHPKAFEFIRTVPTDWEQSIALDGEIGEYVVVARQVRGGKDWYIGALTNEKPRRKKAALKVDLSFLPDDTDFEATIYRDGARAHWKTRPYDFVRETIKVNNRSTLKLELGAGGGAAVHLR